MSGDCDVLVVGAGPTGLMLANWLLRLGVRVVVIDGKDGPTRESRALVLQARSMEIYDQLGVVDEVLAQSRRAEALAPGFESRVFGRIRLGDLGRGVTPYPWLNVLEQSRNEQILYANLRAQGGEVRWGERLISLARVDGGVTATTTGGVVTARFCVGADGSSSAVRTQLGIDFAGVTNAHTFYVIDATAASGMVDGAVNVRLGRADFMLAFPMAGRHDWRLIGVVRDPPADTANQADSAHPAGRNSPAGPGAAAVTEDSIRARLRDVFAVTYGPSRWFATYRVHHRVADRFRAGPVFLAGDAAHVHSPVGAQGMNTGLQDAHNLAFKLADAVHGRAGDGWLDRYEAERRPVALRLVSTTDRVFGLVTSEKAVSRVLRRLAVPLVAPLAVRAVPRVGAAPRFFQYVAQTRIHYWMGPDARQAARGRRGTVVGRRLPWAGDNFAVLRSLQWQIHGYGCPDDPLRQVGTQLALPTHRFAAAPGTPLRTDRLYLVRPDGFVAAEAAADDAAAVFGAALPT